VAPQEVGKPGRAGLGEGQAGDRVHPHGSTTAGCAGHDACG
jgi:hypothetical protein